MPSRLSRSIGMLALLAACSTPAPTSTPTSAMHTSTATAATTSALPPGARRFVVVPERSQATIRVREQIAAVPAPGDAVLTTKAFSGTLVLLADGTTFAPGSRLSVELDTLTSDSDLRDEWIKINTLDTRVYPRAEFTLTRVTGVPVPLPSAGEWSATIDGVMKIHGVERTLAWPVQVTTTAGEVRTRGTTAFKFGDYGMAVPANRLILSVVDEVRLEIDVVARED